eukprot:scaffold3236_cov188-Ochromonas_danica.AAC.6
MASIFDELFPTPINRSSLRSSSSTSTSTSSPAREVFLAISRNDLTKARHLLSSSSSSSLDLSLLVNDFSALHMAAKRGYGESITLLLSYNPSLATVATANGRLPAMVAAYEGQVEALHLLLPHTPHTTCDQAGNTLLHYATWGGSLDCVKLLVEEGLEVHKENHEGLKPFQFAVAGDYSQIVEYLLSLTLHSQEQEVKKGEEQQQQGEEEEDSVSGMTVLHRAAAHGALSALTLLLPHYDRLQRAANGSIPLHYAAQHGHLEVLQALLQTEGGENGVNMLLDHKADPTLQNDDGDNALLLSAAAGRHEICKLLVKKCEMDPFAKDKQGRSAVSKAVQGGFKELANQLAFEATIKMRYQELLEYSASKERL